LPALEAFLQSPGYLSTGRIEQDSASIVQYLQNAPEPSIEGIYQTPDGTYTMAVIKNATAIRDYAGVILASRTKLWAKGQVKLELKQVNDSIFDVYTLPAQSCTELRSDADHKEHIQLAGLGKNISCCGCGECIVHEQRLVQL
jgi:hypothetical protein